MHILEEVGKKENMKFSAPNRGLIDITQHTPFATCNKAYIEPLCRTH